MVRLDQLLGDLSGTGRAGLAVLNDDVDLVGLPADLEALRIGRERPHRAQHELIAGAEVGQVSGERRDEADGDGPGALDTGSAGTEEPAGANGQRAGAHALEQRTPRDRLIPQHPVIRSLTVHSVSL